MRTERGRQGSAGGAARSGHTRLRRRHPANAGAVTSGAAVGCGRRPSRRGATSRPAVARARGTCDTGRGRPGRAGRALRRRSGGHRGGTGGAGSKGPPGTGEPWRTGGARPVPSLAVPPPPPLPVPQICWPQPRAARRWRRGGVRKLPAAAGGPGSAVFTPGRGAVPVPRRCRCQRQHRPPVSWDSRAGASTGGWDGAAGVAGAAAAALCSSAPRSGPARGSVPACPGPGRVPAEPLIRCSR